MDAEDLNRTYLRFAHQFLESYDNPKKLAIVGMQTRGVYMGHRIRSIMKKELDFDIEWMYKLDQIDNEDKTMVFLFAKAMSR